jgi:mannosyltransferase
MAFVVALEFIALWLWPMNGSLWTDEFGTWWVAKGTFSEVGRLAWTYQGQSPLYYAIAWLAGRLGGASEFAVRLPSLLAGLAAAYCFFRLVRRLADDAAAWLGLVAFVGLGGIAFSVTEARPYAFGILTSVAASLALVRWLDGGGRRFGVAAVLLAVASVWFHYMFALVLPAQIAYTYVRARRASAISTRAMVLCGVALVFGIAPLAAQVISLWDRRASLAPANVAGTADLLTAIFPSVLVGGLLLGVLLARAQGEVRTVHVPVKDHALVLLVTWLLVPPVTLMALSLITDQMFMAPRYYVSALPAAAALFGLAARSLSEESVRRIVAIVTAILAILVAGGSLKNGEDWRAAAAFERERADPGTVVLMHQALIESSRLDWFDDPKRRSYLMSASSFYDFDGELIPLPFVLDRPSERYLEDLVRTRLANLDRFVIVTNYVDVPYASWLDGRLGDEGWSSQVTGTFGEIEVIEFTKDAAERSRA